MPACDVQINLRVPKLRRLLGQDAVLLPCNGKRPIPAGWSKLTTEDMDRASYRNDLNDAPNIGVLLGTASGGLCVIDFDIDGAAEEFLTDNPALIDTLRTRGQRGSSVWVRITGEFPASKKLKRGGNGIGEWRANGNQSIICGIHPDTGQPYRFLNDSEPVTIAFDKIKWPDSVSPFGVPADSANGTAGTIYQLTAPTTFQPKNVPASEEKESLALTDAEKSTVRDSLPVARNQNHACLFRLARGIKALEKQHRSEMPAERHCAIFDFWFKSATSYLRPGQSRDDYLFEFLEALECVKYPLGESVLESAWQAAQSSEPPPESAMLKSVQIRLLASLCRELQRNVGDRPFFLATRTIQKLFSLGSHVQAWRWLNGLCRLRILKITKQGRKREAGFAGAPTEFRYLGKIEFVGETKRQNKTEEKCSYEKQS